MSGKECAGPGGDKMTAATYSHTLPPSHTLTHPHAPSHTLTHPHAPSRTLTHPHAPSRTLTGAHALLVATDARLPRGLRSAHLPRRPARLPALLRLWRPLGLRAAPLWCEGVGARAPRAERLVPRDGARQPPEPATLCHPQGCRHMHRAAFGPHSPTLSLWACVCRRRATAGQKATRSTTTTTRPSCR